jgi:hypothetical protein
MGKPSIINTAAKSVKCAAREFRLIHRALFRHGKMPIGDDVQPEGVLA